MDDTNELITERGVVRTMTPDDGQRFGEDTERHLARLGLRWVADLNLYAAAPSGWSDTNIMIAVHNNQDL